MTRAAVRVIDLTVPLFLVGLEIVLNLIAVGTMINVVLLLGLLAVVSSPLWMLLLASFWPVILVSICLLSLKAVRSSIRYQASRLIKYAFY